MSEESNTLSEMTYYMDTFEQPKFYSGGKAAYKQALVELPVEFQNKGKEYAMENWYNKKTTEEVEEDQEKEEEVKEKVKVEVENQPKVFPKKTLAYAREYLGVDEKPETPVETPYSPVMPPTPSLSECVFSPEQGVTESTQDMLVDEVQETPTEVQETEEKVQETSTEVQEIEEKVQETPKEVQVPAVSEYVEKGDFTLAELENEVKSMGIELDEPEPVKPSSSSLYKEPAKASSSSLYKEPAKASSSSLKRKIVESDDELSEMSDIEENEPIASTKAKVIPMKKARVFGTSMKPTVKPAASEKKRKQPGDRTKEEVKRLRNHTDLVIPKASFQRIVRAQTVLPPDFRFTETAMRNLQECTETRIMQILLKMKHAAEHAKRVTLNNSDLEVTLQIEKRD